MSPIEGLSEKTLLPRVGKIRLGVRKQKDDESFYPEPTDYFVCPDEVKAVYGERPRELSIRFPSEDVEQWASQYYRRYSSSLQLLCRGDGKRASERIRHGTADTSSTLPAPNFREVPCCPAMCDYYRKGECRKVMNLQFILPDCPGFGVYQLDTGSIHSIRNVNDVVRFIQTACSRVAMIPLSLQLVEKEVQPGGWPKTAYVLSLTWKSSLTKLQEFALTPPGSALLVPPPDNEAPGDLCVPAASPKPEGAEQAARQERNINDLWLLAQHLLAHREIKGYQIARWFRNNYDIAVDRKDFEPAVAPPKFTAAMLKSFCDAVDMYCDSP